MVKVKSKVEKKKKEDENELVSEKLNAKQELFCEVFASDREFFGNGVQSYIEAYDPPRESEFWYEAAKTSAYRLLTNAYILKRIDQIMETSGFNDVAVDKQLGFLITQHGDFSNKLGAIREYNKLKKRIDDKMKVTIHVPSPIYGGKSKAEKPLEIKKKNNGSKAKGE